MYRISNSCFTWGVLCLFFGKIS